MKLLLSIDKVIFLVNISIVYGQIFFNQEGLELKIILSCNSQHIIQVKLQ